MPSNIDKQKCAERLAHAYAKKELLQQRQLVLQGITDLNNRFHHFNMLAAELENEKEEFLPIIRKHPTQVASFIKMSAVCHGLSVEVIDFLYEETEKQLRENFEIIHNCMNYLED